MVSYYITTPRKQGNGKDTYYVVDVKEYFGGGTTRLSTIRVDQFIPFLKAVFHGELHREYKEIYEQSHKGVIARPEPTNEIKLALDLEKKAKEMRKYLDAGYSLKDAINKLRKEKKHD